MNALKWWMRIVGTLYLFLFVVVTFFKLPIRAEGPAGVLARAAAGDPTASFVVDTWVTLGIWYGVLGTAVLIASRIPAQAAALVWTIIGWELGGIVIDIYKVARGYDLGAPVTWMVIHSVLIVAGLSLLRKARASASQVSASTAQAFNATVTDCAR
jgi:BphX-like protein